MFANRESTEQSTIDDSPNCSNIANFDVACTFVIPNTGFEIYIRNNSSRSASRDCDYESHTQPRHDKTTLPDCQPEEICIGHYHTVEDDLGTPHATCKNYPLTNNGLCIRWKTIQVDQVIASENDSLIDQSTHKHNYT
ncbi:1094_t:CDS:2, partial [Funneliformis geosporum]|uniref:4850_t:CDS:1 n=1 Tax=Funneliformis geosporum TaxID=1117311 RepID=A0A9W4T0R9_9GLOM